MPKTTANKKKGNAKVKTYYHGSPDIAANCLLKYYVELSKAFLKIHGRLFKPTVAEKKKMKEVFLRVTTKHAIIIERKLQKVQTLKLTIDKTIKATEEMMKYINENKPVRIVGNENFEKKKVSNKKKSPAKPR